MKDKSNSVNRPEIEAVQLSLEDLSLTPPRFTLDGKPAKLMAGWTWGLLQENSDEPFNIHMRQFGSNGLSMNYGISRMGDTPTSKPTGLEHCLEMYPGNQPDANPDTPFPSDKQVQYIQIEGDPEGLTDDPFTYEQRASNPQLLYRFSSKHARAVEADFMDLTYDYMPYAMVLNANGPLEHPYIHQHAIIHGTYEGRKVSYVGAWDRMYDMKFEQAFEGKLFAALSFAGVHPDGTREWGMVAKVGKNRGFGYYCKDGEQPVVSTDVKMETTWIPLPYVNNGTMVYEKATYRFNGIVIHYEGKWGTKGQNYKLLTWPGFSGTGGVWYEGDTPYKFKESFAWSENHNALEDELVTAGF
ncbi:MAG: hypothetical protein WBI14_05515 [Anaerolineaceae bacterium]